MLKIGYHIPIWYTSYKAGISTLDHHINMWYCGCTGNFRANDFVNVNKKPIFGLSIVKKAIVNYNNLNYEKKGLPAYFFIPGNNYPLKAVSYTHLAIVLVDFYKNIFLFRISSHFGIRNFDFGFIYTGISILSFQRPQNLQFRNPTSEITSPQLLSQFLRPSVSYNPGQLRASLVSRLPV